jgi:hypothetical protein
MLVLVLQTSIVHYSNYGVSGFFGGLKKKKPENSGGKKERNKTEKNAKTGYFVS